MIKGSLAEKLQKNGPFTILRLSAAEMDFFFTFSSRRTAVKRPLEGRVSAENRGGRSQQGSSRAASAIRKEAFHTTRSAVGAIFLRGASGSLRWKIRSGSEGGQSGGRYRFIPSVVKTPLIAAPTLNPTRSLALKESVMMCSAASDLFESRETLQKWQTMTTT